MKKGKVGLFDPYLDVLGGGEKHILSILKVLDSAGYETDVFWDEDLTDAIKNRFNLTFDSLTFKPNVFKKGNSFVTRTLRLFPYDYFFYVTDGSYFYSPARKNFIFSMVPYAPLYSRSYLNKLKTANATFISNSEFTGKHLKDWGIESNTLYPFIDPVFLEKKNVAKEKIILSVGRFFGGLHVKNHKLMISLFRKLSNQGILQGYKLLLAGGLKDEDRAYFNSLRTLTENDPNILLKPNVDFKELLSLYSKAQFYWHFTGFGVDEKLQPEKTEHLGITPLEAMASLSIVFCYKAGGINELVKDNKNGYTFRTENELIKKLEKVIKDLKLQKKIQTAGRGFVVENFGKDVFEKKVREVLSIQ